ncbi:NAD(P)-dependent oxidoreductase [Deinococcus ruber]|uniref:NADH-flavin reductase n=1 Tax=Deinococcus ruber TaxID=1848197 RepID=A0A918CGA8_9DEIO|nr:NAD(P)H-binding protein [Deinococcus ruber]GGR22224.1 NADH-flavin reductase [Deinococcus ruber]
MKLALLGGTGRTGRLLIDQALERGDTLTALARDPAKLHRRHPRLIAVHGDARDAAVYPELLRGADAVLSVLGPVAGGAPDVMTLAAQHLIALQAALGVPRVVTLTGAGVAHPGDTPTLLDRFIRTMLRLTQPAVLEDATRHADLMRASSLAWTLLRVPRLTDGPIREVRVGRVGTIRPFITRASTAHALLNALEDPNMLRQAPAISN